MQREHIYIYDKLSHREAFQSLFSLALQVLYRCLRTKQVKRLATEHADDRQARLLWLRTCVHRLKSMVLPQACPTMLCIHYSSSIVLFAALYRSSPYIDGQGRQLID